MQILVWVDHSIVAGHEQAIFRTALFSDSAVNVVALENVTTTQLQSTVFSR